MIHYLSANVQKNRQTGCVRPKQRGFTTKMKKILKKVPEYFGDLKIMPTFASQKGKRPDAQRENSSVGRARPCQGRGRGFESRFSLQENNEIVLLLLLEIKVSLQVTCENSSVGRARPCQGRGRGFESRFSLQLSDAVSKQSSGWWNW